MDYDTYLRTAQRVADLVDVQKDYAGAQALLKDLIRSDLPDLDRSMMCLNLATVCEKLSLETEALSWIDRAVDLERPHLRTFAELKKAAWLAARGRDAEAISIYERVARERSLFANEREGIRQNLDLLRSHRAKG